MGSIKLSKTPDGATLTFYVGNGKKDIPRLYVDVPDVKVETIAKAVADALIILRPPSKVLAASS